MFFLLLLLYTFLCETSLSVVGSNGNVSGLTIFNDVPEFVAGGPVRIDIMPHLADSTETREKKNWDLSIFAQYLTSPTNTNKLTEFLFPHQDILLSTTGGPDYFLSTATNKQMRDLDASIVGITDPDFFSVTGIFPRSDKAYIAFFGYYAFSQNKNNTPRLSFQVALPYIHINHTIQGDENIYKTGPSYQTSPIKSVLAGLASPELHFQRWNFDSKGLSQSAFADIELNICYNYLPMEKCSIETYAGCLIPLHNNTKKAIENAAYIFNPSIINAEHFGLQYGTTISLFLYQNDERSIQFTLGNNLLYFLPKAKIRSFDLYQRPWSRYLPAYLNFQLPTQVMTPLTNVLTLKSRVTPNFSNISTVQIDLVKDFYSFGIGYTLFARQSESVTILDDIPNIVIKGASTNTQSNIPPISLVRTAALQLTAEDIICKSPVYDDTNFYYAKIGPTAIDISSATHPAVFLGEIYLKAKIDYCQTIKCTLGGSYRFSHNNTAIEYTTCWAGLQYEF